MRRATWATAAAMSWHVLAIVLFLIAIRPLLRLQNRILARETRSFEKLGGGL